MRQIVIVIADLYFPPAEGEGPPTAVAIGSLPGFEHVARFGEKTIIEDGWRVWLARWLGREDFTSAGYASVAAAALDHPADARIARAPLDSTAWIATPVHLIAGLTNLHLDRRSILRLPPGDLENFARDFARVFAGSGFTLEPTPSGEFLMFGPNTPRTRTTEPARALVGDLGESLPKGADAPVLKRLGAELEMWLHDHPVNQARQQRGEPPVSTLWLWGGGPATARATPTANGPPTAPIDLAFGSDPYLAGLWHLHSGASHPLPDKFDAVFGYPRAHRAALVAEVAPMLHENIRWNVFEALAELDRRFVTPALAALKRGDVESVVLVANDRHLLVRRNDRLRLWRRPLLGIEGLR